MPENLEGLQVEMGLVFTKVTGRKLLTKPHTYAML